jgi:hypothetical protein
LYDPIIASVENSHLPNSQENLFFFIPRCRSGDKNFTARDTREGRVRGSGRELYIIVLLGLGESRGVNRCDQKDTNTLWRWNASDHKSTTLWVCVLYIP